ncbi:hypothetical protein S2M10_29750 [Sphingomonas sp. S2M10]|uniref:hypothetical protein n=1 Tax=Sphingomonas sp. S2M10 TaxID=2705010 RepID=UPI00145673F5|nr:hypothetical protein [Sphingomonas sp. S2M10]NLS27973.1 hypothetical protein [Sphingomonas sp. S2M10]
MTSNEKDEAFLDLCNSVHRLRRSFIRLGLKPPKSIEVADYDDGMKFRAMSPGELVQTYPALGRNDDPEWCANVVGVEVRMPGQWRARERGGRV